MIDVSPKEIKTIQEIFKKIIPDADVQAFGSRVNAQSKLYSDLDLVIRDQYKISDEVMIQLKEAFQESALPFRVDIVDWHATSPEFQSIINKNMESLW